MSLPAPHHQTAHPVAEFLERHETLRAVMEWIADRFADHPDVDDSIDWEDGEEHDEPTGPRAF
jgi:hypothetical protein